MVFRGWVLALMHWTGTTRAGLLKATRARTISILICTHPHRAFRLRCGVLCTVQVVGSLVASSLIFTPEALQRYFRGSLYNKCNALSTLLCLGYDITGVRLYPTAISGTGRWWSANARAAPHEAGADHLPSTIWPSVSFIRFCFILTCLLGANSLLLMTLVTLQNLMHLFQCSRRKRHTKEGQIVNAGA